jgi:hypothetical protein
VTGGLPRRGPAATGADAATAWRSLRVVAWWGVLFLVPAFVGVGGGRGVDVYC